MKNSLFTYLAIPLLFISLTSASAQGNASRDADHEALRALRTKLAAAMDKQDMKAMRSCFTKDFAFTTINQSLLTSESDLQAFYDKMFRQPDSILTGMQTEPKADIQTRFLADNVGYCYGTADETYNLRNGITSKMSNRWTAILVKEDGEWKIAAAHAGVNFLDNPVLSRAASFTTKAAAGAGALGLVIGLIVGAIFFRKPGSQKATT